MPLCTHFFGDDSHRRQQNPDAKKKLIFKVSNENFFHCIRFWWTFYPLWNATHQKQPEQKWRTNCCCFLMFIFLVCCQSQPGNMGIAMKRNKSLCFRFDTSAFSGYDSVIFFSVCHRRHRRENKIARQAYTMNVSLFKDSTNVTLHYETSQQKSRTKFETKKATKKIIII